MIKYAHNLVKLGSRMTEIKIVRNDKNFILEFTIYDLDGNVVDLTGITSIKLKCKQYGDSIVKEINGTVTDPENGQCQFLVKDEFVGVTGEFKAEIEMTFSNGKVLTAPGITIKVIPDLG